MAWITVHRSSYTPPRPVRVNTDRIAYIERSITANESQITFEAGLSLACAESPDDLEKMIDVASERQSRSTLLSP